jgi:putative tricarboxylic transport membrane protein
MKRLGFPVAPLVMGLVLGPLLEKALVQTSSIGAGNLSILFTRPLALTILVLAALMLLGPTLVSRFLRKTKVPAAEHDPSRR